LLRTYSFTSVGESQSQTRQRASQSATSPPIGIVTPLEFGTGEDGLLKMHHDLGNNIADNLRNLIMTNKGERLLDYNFGANLRELTFELGSEETDIEAVNRIKQAASRYLPYVSLETFEPFNLLTVDNSISRIGVKVTYRVPLVDNKVRGIEVTLYTAS
jgi:phage baseplate assembly protein W